MKYSLIIKFFLSLNYCPEKMANTSRASDLTCSRVDVVLILSQTVARHSTFGSIAVDVRSQKIESIGTVVTRKDIIPYCRFILLLENCLTVDDMIVKQRLIFLRYDRMKNIKVVIGRNNAKHRSSEGVHRQSERLHRRSESLIVGVIARTVDV